MVINISARLIRFFFVIFLIFKLYSQGTPVSVSENSDYSQATQRLKNTDHYLAKR